jgi:RimJ/RimL family protein N-acetyltransferase
MCGRICQLPLCRTRAYRALGLDRSTPGNRQPLTQARRLAANSMRAQNVRADSRQLERMDGSRRGSLARAIPDSTAAACSDSASTRHVRDRAARRTPRRGGTVTQFVTEDGKPLSRFAAWRAFAGIVGHWTLRGFGLFAVTERTSGAFVGRIGPWDPEGWPDFEIGWALRAECWGQGYATEAVKRCIEYAFTELDRTHLSSFIVPENTRSIRVAQRVGERFECETTLPHLPDRKVLQYGLSRHDWHPRQLQPL